MLAQSLLEYGLLDSLTSGVREFQIWLGDVRYSTWLILGGAVLFIAFLWRYRTQR
jgi:hypothetical protein